MSPMNTHTKCAFLLVTVIIISSSCLQSINCTLKLVLMVHRHGDRNPIRSYPNDPYKNDSNWPDGLGELRPEGKRRLYKMGQMLRTRYQDFLTDNPREVHVRSSAADRCLESVSSLLAGLYPPNGRWVWNENLNWQPFPIQTKPRPQDGMLVTTSNCPAAEAELRKIRASKKMIDYTNQFKDLFNFLHLNSGANVTDIIEAGNLCDVLKIEKLAGHQLPSWVTDQILDQLLSILDMTFYFDFSTKVIQRLRSGLLFKDMVTRMKYVMGVEMVVHRYNKHGYIIENDGDIEFVENTKNKKLFIYSSHDTQIAVTLQAMNAFNMKAPPYGSSIIFELHEHDRDSEFNGRETHNPNENNENIHLTGKQDKFYLKVFFWNQTDTNQMIPLIVPGCTNPGLCPVKRFIESMNEYVPKDWSSECSLSVIDRINSAMFEENLILVVIIGSMSVVFLFFVYMFVKRRRSQKSRLDLIDESDEDNEQLEDSFYSDNSNNRVIN